VRVGWGGVSRSRSCWNRVWNISVWWSLAATASLSVAREGGKAPLEIMEVVQGEYLLAILPTQRTLREWKKQSNQRFTTWRANGKENPQPLFTPTNPYKLYPVKTKDALLVSIDTLSRNRSRAHVQSDQKQWPIRLSNEHPLRIIAFASSLNSGLSNS